MENLGYKIANELQKLSDVELQNLGNQSIYIVSAYYKNKCNNLFLYDAEIVFVGDYIENNFKVNKILKEKLVLNKRGTILGIYKGKKVVDNKICFWIENYSYYNSNPINANLQYSTKNEKKEAILLNTKFLSPYVVFETIKIDKCKNVVENINNSEIVLERDLENYKKELVKNDNIKIDNNTFYKTQYLTKKNLK